MRRTALSLALAVLALAALAVLLFVTPKGYTRLQLEDVDAARPLLDAVLRNGEPVTLTWQNSIYQLPVVEVFYAADGRLVLDTVSFLDPNGAVRNPVRASDVNDLYHTGGPFSASGMDRPYTDVIFRIGEIGNPHMAVRGRVVAFKDAVGFGGRVHLMTGRPSLGRALLSTLSR